MAFNIYVYIYVVVFFFILPKDIPSVGVLMMAVESAV